MDNIKNDVYYLKQMIEDIEFIISKTKDIEFDVFEIKIKNKASYKNR